MAKLQVDESLVRKLSRLLEETGLTEIEYEAAGQRIRVARNGIAVALPAAVAPVPQKMTACSGPALSASRIMSRACSRR